MVANPPAGPGRAPVQVLGGPGTGKTALLVDVAVSRLRLPRARADAVLVLTPGARAARDLRRQVTAGLTDTDPQAGAPVAGRGGSGTGRTVREPLVRTVHSYAFAVLRLQAARHGNPPPRLITGPEQDAVVRELLRGDLVDGAPRWPVSLRPALGLAGFATELRDLLLRAAERGAGPEDLVRLGRVHGRSEWVAAGQFWATYEQSVLLRAAVGMEAPQASAPAVDAAGLVAAALDALHGDAELLGRERERVRHLLVDDAQHLDAGAAQLVSLLGAGSEETVVAGDPDQAVFGFRGADPAFLTGLAGPTGRGGRRVLLDTTHRCTVAVAAAAATISTNLPGAGPQRGPRPAPGAGDGSVGVHVLPTVAQEAALVADTVRRAHLVDGVPWSDIAVIVRSAARSLPALRRAVLAAGVPLRIPAAELPLARQHAAAGFLLALTAVSSPPGEASVLVAEQVTALLASPLGRADPVALRRLRRGLRRVELAAGGDRSSAELLRELVLAPAGPGGPNTLDEGLLRGLTDAELAPLRRVQAVLAAARDAVTQRLGVEEVLWAAWQASGAQRRWLAASDRGGTAGAQADRDLDAIIALFDAAARYTDRLPRGTVAGFVTYLSDQEIAGDSRSDQAAGADAVTVLTAHSAVGRQWRVVVVAGVQEGLWPSLRTRGSVLGTEALVDELAGGPGPELAAVLSRSAPLLAQERRLFLVACSRAGEQLVVTAVRSAAGDAELVPSRFLDELGVPVPTGALEDPSARPPRRSLELGALVADLRAAACAPGTATGSGTDPDRRERAAAQLARLAAAGVPGAHPDQWYGLGGVSTTAPLWRPADGPVRVSPSTVELLSACPLRWALERHGGQDGSAVAAVSGTLVHLLVQALAGHTPRDVVDARLAGAWTSVDLGAPWFAEHELQRTRTMLDAFQQWWRSTRGELTEVGTEVEVAVELSGEVDGEVVTAHVAGRIDRLERDRLGRLVVVDVKTGKNPVTKAAAQENPQLATYQLAVGQGGVVSHPQQGPTGGARLVYVAKTDRSTGAAERVQPAPDAETEQRWRTQLLTAAASTRGPQFVARINDGCRHCPVRSSCPAQDTGRPVTQP
ncbi:MAG: ATP-dependent DNA helicase [Mycobacteriaceae bacterium]